MILGLGEMMLDKCLRNKLDQVTFWHHLGTFYLFFGGMLFGNGSNNAGIITLTGELSTIFLSLKFMCGNHRPQTRQLCELLFVIFFFAIRIGYWAQSSYLNSLFAIYSYQI